MQKKHSSFLFMHAFPFPSLFRPHRIWRNREFPPSEQTLLFLHFSAFSLTLSYHISYRIDMTKSVFFLLKSMFLYVSHAEAAGGRTHPVRGLKKAQKAEGSMRIPSRSFRQFFL